MEDYEVLGEIGSGQFGRVMKIMRKSDKKVLVWKELEYGKMDEKEKSQLVAEVNILREVKHPNVVRYYDRIIDKQNQNIYIIMEYCERGDLAVFLKKLKYDRETIPEKAIWEIFMQIVLALHEIHHRKIMHRDLKPANIFLDSKNNVKLGDFGLSKKLSDNTNYAYTNVGTPYYMSPEKIEENKYNEKSDIWACGCLLYELGALAPPFPAQNHYSLALKIREGEFERLGKQYSDELMRVITWCLQRNPTNRPSVDDLLSLPNISMQLREKRLLKNKEVLKTREEENMKKEEQLKLAEQEITRKEEEVQKKRSEIEQKIKELEERKQQLTCNIANSNIINSNYLNQQPSISYLQLQQQQQNQQQVPINNSGINTIQQRPPSSQIQQSQQQKQLPTQSQLTVQTSLQYLPQTYSVQSPLQFQNTHQTSSSYLQSNQEVQLQAQQYQSQPINNITTQSGMYLSYVTQQNNSQVNSELDNNNNNPTNNIIQSNNDSNSTRSNRPSSRNSNNSSSANRQLNVNNYVNNLIS